MVCNAVRNAFLNALRMGPPSPCVPAAFNNGERHSHVFPIEMTPIRNSATEQNLMSLS